MSKHLIFNRVLFLPPPYNHQGFGDFQDPLYALNSSDSSQLLPDTQLIIDTVTQSINASKDILIGLNSNSQIDEIMSVAFGQDYQKDLTDQLFAHLAQNNFTNAPEIQLVSDQSFNGAYAKETNTIYLSQEFVEANLANVGAVTGVILEEYGHYIDGQINVQDASGDEGDIFSQLVRGQSISGGELLGLKNEDDTGIIFINNQPIYIEQSQSNFDVNGDGKADIVGFYSDRIFVSIGNGNGTFKTATADTPGFTKNYGWNTFNDSPRMLADVNGDGKADIVGFDSDRIFVSIGNGNGTFKTATADTPGFTKNYGWNTFNDSPRMLADVNGDGKADIVGFYSDRVFVSIGNGNGTFKTATADTPGFTKNYGWTNFNEFPRMLADVNGDGKADIVGFYSDRVFVSIGNGNGTFKAATAATPGFTKNYGWNTFNDSPRMLADVNGDGKADIVGFDSDRIFVSIGNGNGTFKAATATTPGFTKNYGWNTFNDSPRMLADVNGDGKADIVGFDSDRIFVSIGNGNGTFKAATADTPGFTKNYGWNTFDDSPRIVGSQSLGGFASPSGYYRELSSLTEEQWDKLGGESAQFGSLANFSGGDKNTQTISNNALQVYKDMSKTIFGTENKVNAGYGYDFGYYGTFGAHSGIDIQTSGQIVKSAINGVVAVAPFQYYPPGADTTKPSTNGWWMAIDEVNASGQKTGRRWWYGHLDFNGSNSNSILGKGTRVTAGQTTIARQVLSGQGHLHLTVTTPTASELSTPTARSDYNNVANGKVDLNRNGKLEDGEEYIRSVNAVRGRTMNPLHAYWLFRNI